MRMVPMLFKAHLMRPILSRYKTETRRFSVIAEPGDVIWARETFCCSAAQDESRKPERGDYVLYPATDEIPEGYRLIPCIYMPRWACRCMLDVARVRKMPLQQINRRAIRREGIPSGKWRDFRRSWDAIYGGDPEKCWESNPVVVAHTFRARPPSHIELL